MPQDARVNVWFSRPIWVLRQSILVSDSHYNAHVILYILEFIKMNLV
jgi:hypothetical protein